MTTCGIEREMTMRLLAFAAAAALAACIASAADAAPREKRVYANPPGTVVTTRDESGRTRTKILVQKRSYLDGGTEVMPSDNIDSFRSSFMQHQPSGVTTNTAFDRHNQDWIGDPFFLAGKRNPYPWSGN
jgi:hypothetical protein